MHKIVEECESKGSQALRGLGAQNTLPWSCSSLRIYPNKAAPIIFDLEHLWILLFPVDFLPFFRLTGACGS